MFFCKYVPANSNLFCMFVNGAQSFEALGPQPPNLLSTERKHLGRVTWHMEKPVLPEQKCNIGCTVIICYGSVFLQIFRLKNDQTPLVGLATRLHLASSSGETGSHLQSCNHQIFTKICTSVLVQNETTFNIHF